jgi:dipeptidyl aminopeptidase/acylaminoacyl peptidase
MLAMRTVILILIASAATLIAGAQQPPTPVTTDRIEQLETSSDRNFEVIDKKIDDVLWFFRVGDVAHIDKVRIPSTKPVRMENPTGQGAGNPLVFWAYTFIPKKLSGKAPLIVFVHGGVHAAFDSVYYTHIVRELLDEGYIIVAPEYRGSTGYGASFYKQIDYGGAEIDDTYAARNWAVETVPQVDGSRVGIIGWSHGGYHALLNVFQWPDAYQVAYAGVPVSDLVQRMGYKSAEYREIFEGFIGKQAEDDPAEYRRRSPVYHASKLRTPLLIHTNTNDEDVNVMEVEHLIAALKAAGKSFEFKVYQNAPGGHAFNRLDTNDARASRREIYQFLARHLK